MHSKFCTRLHSTKEANIPIPFLPENPFLGTFSWRQESVHPVIRATLGTAKKSRGSFPHRCEAAAGKVVWIFVAGRNRHDGGSPWQRHKPLIT
ncbi:hypothetical protein CDAR_76841 [Caerostris darwini]|uniref:Uncharacterized protein n=1 Tax=Caerostris darwini TaxID=1538125 RepID=A0AAV4QHN5_9ARAC|nr:hypothetical protein CDAR_76841 [Caerostris darwini]